MGRAKSGGGFSGGSSSRSSGGFSGGSRSSGGRSYSSSSRSSGSRGFTSSSSRSVIGKSVSSSRSRGFTPSSGGSFSSGGRVPIYRTGRAPSMGPMYSARRPRRSTGPVIINNYGGMPVTPVRRRSSGAMVGCATLIVLVIVIAIILAVFTAISSSRPTDSELSYSTSSEITHSTKERTRLSGTTWSNDCYTDELGWISNSATLTNGLREFYDETGVLPYLYLTDNVNGDTMPTIPEVQSFAETQYDKLFSDEAHFLLVFVESTDLERTGENFVAGYAVGHQARTVMDDEAIDILADYIKAYYYQDGLSDEQYFANAFSEAGTSMMTVYHSPWIKVAIIFIVAAGAIVVLLIARSIYQKKAQREKEKAEETERILNTPLEKYGASGTDDLAAKYDTNRANAAGASAARNAAANAAAGAQATAQATATAAARPVQAAQAAASQAAGNVGQTMDAAEQAAQRYMSGGANAAADGAQAAASAVDEAEALAAKYNVSQAAAAGASAATAAADSIAESAVEELSQQQPDAGGSTPEG